MEFRKRSIDIRKSDRHQILHLYLDDECWKEIHTTLFGRTPKWNWNATTLAELEEQFSQIEYRAAFTYILKRLAVQNLYSTDVKAKLKRLMVSEEATEKVIHECQKIGFLNDEAWIESFVRRQLARKYGPKAILAKLRAKGIDSKTAQTILQKSDAPEQEQERIQTLLQTKYRSYDLKDYKTRHKVFAALVRKGFSFEVIQKAINHHGVTDSTLSFFK